MKDAMLNRPVTIAVIDDNVEFGVGIKLMLAKDGVEIHTAGDGVEGLNLVRQLLPDIVLLDVVMPGMSGIEVCKEIKQTPELSDILVVMLSGIAPEKVEKLFRIDLCESTPGTNKEKGTGLGLVLCKEFVEKHGGRIWAESEEGKGSDFCFTLPLAAES